MFIKSPTVKQKVQSQPIHKIVNAIQKNINKLYKKIHIKLQEVIQLDKRIFEIKLRSKTIYFLKNNFNKLQNLYFSLYFY